MSVAKDKCSFREYYESRVSIEALTATHLNEAGETAMAITLDYLILAVDRGLPGSSVVGRPSRTHCWTRQDTTNSVYTAQVTVVIRIPSHCA